jgi:hypothetical protein
VDGSNEEEEEKKGTPNQNSLQPDNHINQNQIPATQ